MRTLARYRRPRVLSVGTDRASATASPPAASASPARRKPDAANGSREAGDACRGLARSLDRKLASPVRSRSAIAGSAASAEASTRYRSIVDLGSGPKLTGADFTITDPKHRLFDQIHVRAPILGRRSVSNGCIWTHRKQRSITSARTIATSPTSIFCRPTPIRCSSRGIVLNEQSFDTRRHFASFSLDLLPGNWIHSLFCFRSRFRLGHRRATLRHRRQRIPGAESIARHRPICIAAGVRIERRRFHVTLEQGGTTFKDDQSLFQPPGTNLGNVHAPIFGQTHRSDQPAGLLWRARLEHLQQRLLHCQPGFLARFLRSVSVQPAAIERELSAVRHRQSAACRARSCSIPASNSWFRRRRRCPTPPEVSAPKCVR